MPDETIGETATTVSESTDFNLSIRIPMELINLADDAGRRLNLKRADVIRLSLGRGIDRLLSQLESTTGELDELIPEAMATAARLAALCDKIEAREVGK